MTKVNYKVAARKLQNEHEQSRLARQAAGKHNMTGEQLDESLVALALVVVVVAFVAVAASLRHSQLDIVALVDWRRKQS